MFQVWDFPLARARSMQVKNSRPAKEYNGKPCLITKSGYIVKVGPWIRMGDRRSFSFPFFWSDAVTNEKSARKNASRTKAWPLLFHMISLILNYLLCCIGEMRRRFGSRIPLLPHMFVFLLFTKLGWIPRFSSMPISALGSLSDPSRRFVARSDKLTLIAIEKSHIFS